MTQNTDDEDFEIEQDVPEITSPFAQAFGPEILDRKISNGAFRLFMRYKFEVGQAALSVHNFDRLASEMGVKSKTVKGWHEELKTRGLLKEEKVDGKTTTSVISPSEVYGRRALANGGRDE